MGGQEEEEEEEEDALTVGAFAALEWMIATAHLRRRITGLHEVNSVHGGRTHAAVGTPAPTCTGVPLSVVHTKIVLSHIPAAVNASVTFLTCR